MKFLKWSVQLMFLMDKIKTPIDIKWKGHLTLVRHGETQHNFENRFVGVTDDPLSEKGKKQAKEAAGFLKKLQEQESVDFQLILSSPLSRAYDTAQIINKELNIPLKKSKLLRERNYGVFESLKKSEAAEKYPDLYARYKKEKPFVDLPDGETALSVEKRVTELLQNVIVKEFQGLNEIILVGHLNIIRAAFRLFGLSDWKVYFQPFENASISRIRINKGNFDFGFCDKCPLSEN